MLLFAVDGLTSKLAADSGRCDAGSPCRQPEPISKTLEVQP